ncbi:MAG: aromatic amino acid transaminase [Chlamydiota bacterium]|jgi:aspartate/tyrosine/aromatic aminotransferase
MIFDHIEKGSADPVFGLVREFKLDPRKDKHFLGIGVYQDERGKKAHFTSVLAAQKIVEEQRREANYLPIKGSSEFTDTYGSLVFTENVWEEIKERTSSVQTLGGTGALKVGFDFLNQFISNKICYFEPTWPNHKQIINHIAMDVTTASYLDSNKLVDFEKILDVLSHLPEKTTVLLQASCHNPTGADFSYSQLKELSELMLRKKLLPFFDLSYQGLGMSLSEDAYSIQIFIKDGHDMLVAATCSKNFGLYSQRVGALFVVTQNDKQKENVSSNLGPLIRANYSNPPSFGADLVTCVLRNSQLRNKWELELEQRRSRLANLRSQLVGELSQKSTANFDFLLRQKGMFSYLGLSEMQVQELKDKFGIYLLGNSRMNFASLNKSNFAFILDAIVKVCK